MHVPLCIRSSSEHMTILAVIDKLYACKCACRPMAYFVITGIFGNFCTERGGEFLSFRTGIPDGPVVDLLAHGHFSQVAIGSGCGITIKIVSSRSAMRYHCYRQRIFVSCCLS